MERKLRTLLITLVSAIMILLPINAHAAGVVAPSVSYQGHVQNIGWQNWVSDGQEAGTDGKSFRVEALKIKLVNAPAGASIKYQAHVQNVGWQKWVADGAEAGTDDKSLRVEAIKISLENMPGYSIQYQAYVENIGWQDWVSDGQEAGTDGKSFRVEAIKIRIVKISDNSTIGVQYQGYVQNIGCQDTVQNGQISGTEGKSLRVEALKIGLLNAPAGAKIKYQTQVQNIGWQNPVADNQEAGTEGKSFRVETLKIVLENLPGYSVQYRVQVQNIGWMNWVSDGQVAGTEGQSLKVEGIEIRIIKTADGSTPTPVPFVTTGSFIYGNTSGNINNWGMAAYDGEFIYCNRSSDGNKIYRERADGTGLSKVNETSGGCINVVGDWVYYTVGYSIVPEDMGIFKVKKDGSSKTKITQDAPFFISVVNDWIYYIAPKSGVSSSLYKIKVDGSNKTELKFDITDSSLICIDEPELAVVGDWVYLNLFKPSDNTHHLYRVRTNGSITEKVLDVSPNRQFAIVDNFIYYINNNNEICKANSDGSNITLLYKTKEQNFSLYSLNIANNNIYFSADNQSADVQYRGIYKINLDGTGLTKLTNTWCKSFCIVTDWIYFDGQNAEKRNTMKIKIDGSNETDTP